MVHIKYKCVKRMFNILQNKCDPVAVASSLFMYGLQNLRLLFVVQTIFY